jgi:hypothetical protein
MGFNIIITNTSLVGKNETLMRFPWVSTILTIIFQIIQGDDDNFPFDNGYVLCCSGYQPLSASLGSGLLAGREKC